MKVISKTVLSSVTAGAGSVSFGASKFRARNSGASKSKLTSGIIENVIAGLIIEIMIWGIDVVTRSSEKKDADKEQSSFSSPESSR